MTESVAQLLKQNGEFRKLFKDHQRLEEKIEKINKQRYLSDKDEVERKRLQKLKLQTKDRMEEYLVTAFQHKKGTVEQ